LNGGQTKIWHAKVARIRIPYRIISTCCADLKICGPERFQLSFRPVLRRPPVPAQGEHAASIAETLAHPGPIICNIQVTPNETLWPKAIAVPQADGTLLSMPLEDMTPLLPRDELRAQMIVGLTEESEKVVV
jgi:hypothetical protein